MSTLSARPDNDELQVKVDGVFLRVSRSRLLGVSPTIDALVEASTDGVLYAPMGDSAEDWRYMIEIITSWPSVADYPLSTLLSLLEFSTRYSAIPLKTLLISYARSPLFSTPITPANLYDLGTRHGVATWQREALLRLIEHGPPSAAREALYRGRRDALWDFYLGHKGDAGVRRLLERFGGVWDGLGLDEVEGEEASKADLRTLIVELREKERRTIEGLASSSSVDALG